jgi:3-oxoacyl-[acyl-carrier protein] reductase
MRGRAALITGAANGLGQRFAAALAEAGVDVAGIDVADQAQTAGLVESAGRRYLALSADVTDADAVRGAVEEAAAALGKLEIVVPCAGVYPSTPFETIALEDWRRILAINLDGPFLTVQAALPHLKRAGWGRVVIISSSTVWLGVPTLVPYVTTKMGLIGFTRALAVEVGDDNITVNAITPGLTETPTTLSSWVGEQFDWVVGQQAVKRREQPEDLVSTLLYLCDERSGFITGQTINVDGGLAKH